MTKSQSKLLKKMQASLARIEKEETVVLNSIADYKRSGHTEYLNALNKTLSLIHGSKNALKSLISDMQS